MSVDRARLLEYFREFEAANPRPRSSIPTDAAVRVIPDPEGRPVDSAEGRDQ